MRTVIVGGAAVLAALVLGPPAARAGGSASDVMLFGKDLGDGSGYACYLRKYDANHLAAHPKQNVRDMLLFVHSYIDSDAGRQYGLEIGVSFRKNGQQFQVGGGCDPSASGKSALNCAIDCDGGEIDVSVKDANAVLVSIPWGARTWDPESGDDAPEDAHFGKDDKLFRLDRTALKDCLPLVDDDDEKAALSGAN